MVDDIRPSQNGDRFKDWNKPEPVQSYEQPSRSSLMDGPGPEEPFDSQDRNNKGFINVPSIQPPGKVNHPPKSRTFFGLGLKIWPSSKQHKMLGSVVAVFIIIFGSGSLYALNKYFSQPVADPVSHGIIKKPPKTTEISKLTGIEVPVGTNERPIVSIQIENSPDARPQAGLVDAGVVFEAIAEGGITRFNASFLETQPDYIGPIRSVRPYYAALAAPFDPVFVHAGGSGDGLAKIAELGLKDFDHGANGGAFQRVRDRFAPHNLYSSIQAINARSAERGYTGGDTKSLQRKKKETPAEAVTAKTVDIAISGPLYNVHFDYAKDTNSYNRVMAGSPHTDHRSGKQISPKVVVALAMTYSKNGIYSVYNYNGAGEMYVFQDGVVTKGKWEKKGDKEQFIFTDEAGKPIALNPGQTWVTLVSGIGDVKFAP